MREPFPHVASLNLFREPNGSHEITVAGGNIELIQPLCEAGLKPIDVIENLIIQAADIMKARKLVGGSYRTYQREGQTS